MPRTKTHRAHCPACRALQHARTVGKATVGGRAVTLNQCQAPGCELVWAVRPPTA